MNVRKVWCYRHHPDISEEPSAEQDFVKIQEAYEVLTKKRDAAQADPENSGWDFHDWYIAALDCVLLVHLHQYAQHLQPAKRQQHEQNYQTRGGSLEYCTEAAGNVKGFTLGC